jgi:curli production assembly/transport component CsgG
MILVNSRFLVAILSIFMLSACTTGMLENMAEEPVVSDSTKSGDILKNLPLPKERIPVAVYEFQDQTGQFKPSETTTDYSSAVTKGALAVLTKALNDTANRQWFMVAERGGLKNLLQERQIIEATRAQYQDPRAKNPPPPLPPLLFAGMLIEGGIIFYDSNVVTGGAAASYFGIGGHTDYRRDIITVYLRAVSISTGEVLASVTSSKTVFSYGAGINVMRYLSYDKLLEAEGGFTVNEPGQLAVRQAIESGLYALIMEGAAANLWEFSDPAAGKKAMEEYLKLRDGKKNAEMIAPKES